MKEPKILEKFADEERVFAFDFSKQPDVVDVENPLITISPATTPALTTGPAAVEGTNVVKAEFQGGKAGQTYLIECRIETSEGAVVSMYGRLAIVDPSTWQ